MRLPLCPISLPQLKMLLVKTVSSRRTISASATACTVVPLARMTDAPSGTRLAARRPMARLPSTLVTWRTVISGSLCSSEIAPPWVLRRRWLSASATRSRRMVSRETFSLRWISVIEIEPRPFTMERISRCLSSASTGSPIQSWAIRNRLADVIAESPLGIFSTLLHIMAIML